MVGIGLEAAEDVTGGLLTGVPSWEKVPGSVSPPQVRLQIAVWGVPTYNHRLQTDIISLCAKNATLVLLYTFYNAVVLSCES